MKACYLLLATTAAMSTLFSCQKAVKLESPMETAVDFVENGETFSLADASKLKEEPEKETAVSGKGEVFVNEVLPQTYTSRKTIKGLSSQSYDIYLIPGNIVRFDEVSNNYVIVTPKSILTRNAVPKVELLRDEILYSNRINNKANFNASALIGGVTVDAEQLMELIVQDFSKSTAPDSLIDENILKAYNNKIPAAKKKNYFFVKSCLLTLVTYKKYTKSDFSAKVNASYVTAEGKVYASRDKFSKERVVSVDLVSFDDILEQAQQSNKPVAAVQ